MRFVRKLRRVATRAKYWVRSLFVRPREVHVTGHLSAGSLDIGSDVVLVLHRSTMMVRDSLSLRNHAVIQQCTAPGCAMCAESAPVGSSAGRVWS